MSKACTDAIENAALPCQLRTVDGNHGNFGDQGLESTQRDLILVGAKGGDNHHPFGEEDVGIATNS